MTTLFIDADACPVRSEAITAATRHRVPVTMVCNGGIRPVDAPGVTMVYVDSGADEADKWIAAACAPGDVVLTADIPLAARAIDAGAVAIKPDGAVLDARTIGHVLAMRDLAADLRSADPFRQGGGKPFGPRDRARFSQALDRLLHARRPA